MGRPSGSTERELEVWQQHLLLLQRFVSEHDFLPRASVSVPPEEKRLARWKHMQIHRYKNGTLMSWQSELLDRIAGWSWEINNDQWDDWYSALCEFIQSNNRPPLCSKRVGTDEKLLANWANNQRQRHKKRRLPPERQQKLESLPDWSWGRHINKHTLESVKRYFAEKGCELLETTYRNPKIKMPYVCECGRRGKISLDRFHRGQRCRKCRDEKVAEAHRHSIAHVKAFYADRGCVLLDDEYVDTHTSMRYVCECGQEARGTFHDFQDGCRCKKCGEKKRRQARALSFAYVRLFFAEHNCVLLEEDYINNSTNMRFICVCGEKYEKSFAGFSNGPWCRECGVKKQHDQIRFEFDNVKAFFAQHGCQLLATTYKNTQTDMPYICRCGRYSEQNFAGFQKSKRCKDCASDELARNRRFNYEYVRLYFEYHGCVLLEKTYDNNSMPLRYVCECGNESAIRFSNFREGHRCPKCGNAKKSNKRHDPWNDSDDFAGGMKVLLFGMATWNSTGAGHASSSESASTKQPACQ